MQIFLSKLQRVIRQAGVIPLTQPRGLIILEPSPRPFAIVAGDFTPWGGMDRPNYELAWHLAQRVGAEVHLVGHRVAKPLSDHPRVVWHRVPRPFGRHAIGAPLLDRRGRRVAARVKRAGGTVIVNGGNCLWDDVNWIHYVHNVPGPPPVDAQVFARLRVQWVRRRDRAREQLAVQRARLVIADSVLAGHRLIEGTLIDAARVRTVYYGVDPEVFRPASEPEKHEARVLFGLPADRPLVVFVGALGLDRRKGFDVLYDAWNQCLEDPGWDAVLAVAGTGPDLSHWKQRVEESGRSGQIRMLGFCENIPTLLAAADALVSPTRFEPYGQGVHEAICCGLPAFVTRCAGIAERFPADLHDMILDDPPNAAQICQRLLAWRRDLPSYRARMVHFADQLRGRTWSDMAEEMLALITGGDQ